jgi:predicted O-methyltransferase YrrM
VIAEGAADDVYPLPLSSAAAARTLAKLGVTADVVYLDAAHEEQEVLLDLELYWPLVRRGGAMFGHDYNWPGVKKAVDSYFGRRNLELEETYWLVRRSHALLD